MYKNNKISISIPAYNEEKFIIETLKRVPEYVDFVVVVNDCSKDKTSDVVKNFAKNDKRVVLIDMEKNTGGPGLPVKTAHNRGVEMGADILVVMGGDNQMDPVHLPLLLDEIIENKFDYVKGNRFYHRKDLKKMPKVRLVGNIFVSFLNKFCTGYWSISDPLNGYTALRASVYNNLDKDNIADKYDLEVSMFNVLYMVDAKVKDVFIPAIYRDEVSDIKLVRDTIRTTKTLLKGFLYRMWWKKLLFSLSLVPIFYVLGSILLLFSLIYGSWVIYTTLGETVATAGTILLAVVPFFLGIQFLLQGLVLDIQSEPR